MYRTLSGGVSAGGVTSHVSHSFWRCVCCAFLLFSKALVLVDALVKSTVESHLKCSQAVPGAATLPVGTLCEPELGKAETRSEVT